MSETTTHNKTTQQDQIKTNAFDDEKDDIVGSVTSCNDKNPDNGDNVHLKATRQKTGKLLSSRATDIVSHEVHPVTAPSSKDSMHRLEPLSSPLSIKISRGAVTLNSSPQQHAAQEAAMNSMLSQTLLTPLVKNSWEGKCKSEIKSQENEVNSGKKVSKRKRKLSSRQVNAEEYEYSRHSSGNQDRHKPNLRRQSPRTIPEVSSNKENLVAPQDALDEIFTILPEDIRDLVSLDQFTYKNELDIISDKIFHENVFPSCFPWHKSKVLLAPSTPRDIEEVAAILKSDYDFCFDLEEARDPIKSDCPREENSSGASILKDAIRLPEVVFANVSETDTQRDVWKYSSYTFSNPSIFCTSTSSGMGYVSRLSNAEIGRNERLFKNMHAHVERSSDPGIQLLTVALDPFISQDKALLREEKEDFINNSGVLPWSWNELQKEKFQQHRMGRNNIDRKEAIDQVKIYTRQWKVSVKVGGVSSRSSLFRKLHDRKIYLDQAPANFESSIPLAGCLYFRGPVSEPHALLQKRKCANQYELSNKKRLRLASAVMPALVQNGNTITLDVALAEELDVEKNCTTLGANAYI